MVTPTKLINISKQARDRIMADKIAEHRAQEAKRQRTMELAMKNGISIVHIFNPDYPKGGMTVAFRKTRQYASTRMVEVAVASCSPEDMFNKKIGTGLAIQAFIEGQTIELPLLTGYRYEDVNAAVKATFTAMYDAI